jgi:hypothetical protein
MAHILRIGRHVVLAAVGLALGCATSDPQASDDDRRIDLARAKADGQRIPATMFICSVAAALPCVCLTPADVEASQLLVGVHREGEPSPPRPRTSRLQQHP